MTNEILNIFNKYCKLDGRRQIKYICPSDFMDLANKLEEAFFLCGVINWVAVDNEKPPIGREVMFYENGEIYTSEMDKWQDIIYIDEPVFPTHWAEKPKPPYL